MVGAMPICEADPQPASPQVRENCPDCNAELAVLSIIAGRAGTEYWTQRCTRCGGIHLDIVNAAEPAAAI